MNACARVYWNMTFSCGCCTGSSRKNSCQGKSGVFVKKKDGGTIPKDENDNFSLAVIFAFS